MADAFKNIKNITPESDTVKYSSVCLFLVIFFLFCFFHSNTFALSSDLLNNLKDGSYIGSAAGYEGPIKVKVAVKSNRIEKITILSHRESLPSTSFTDIPEKIVAAQKTDVHSVSGATITSDAVMRAVKKALESSKPVKSLSQSTLPVKSSTKESASKRPILKGNIIRLPEPALSDVSLKQALLKRCSTRVFGKGKPDLSVISNLLWAANGVNRPKRSLRTAPSARNWQEIDIYIALESGFYKYDHKSHSLIRRVNRDVRDKIAIQPFVGTAQAVLVYVCDRKRMKGCSDKDVDFYAGADAAFISQNVYLYCASHDLSTVVVAMLKKKIISSLLRLSRNERPVFVQPVGFPVRNSSDSAEHQEAK